jgi:Uma2 family endonuclease
MTDEQFYEFCRINRDLRIERTAEGDLVIAPPAGGRTSARNAEITFQLGQWAKGDGRGVAFDSSGGFRLPSGATRSPDAAWVGRSRLEKLRDEEKEKFLPLCPDFVIELRSPSDAIGTLRVKMKEYMAERRPAGLAHRPGRPAGLRLQHRRGAEGAAEPRRGVGRSGSSGLRASIGGDLGAGAVAASRFPRSVPFAVSYTILFSAAVCEIQ